MTGPCVALALAALLLQAAPQRVERVTEYRWCVQDGRTERARLERARYLRVDGAPAGREEVEVLLELQAGPPDEDLYR